MVIDKQVALQLIDELHELLIENELIRIERDSLLLYKQNKEKTLWMKIKGRLYKKR
jgi:hypothetical protein